MKTRIALAVVVVLALAMAGAAQTKISGTAQCAKPSPQNAIEIGDRPNHSLAISQSKCSWTKPWEIAGIQSKEGASTWSDEISGNSSRGRGYYTDTMANGDKAYYRYDVTGTLKDGAPQTLEAKWSLVRGSGKLKGVKGKGTCKGKPSADGGVTWDCEGEYEMPK